MTTSECFVVQIDRVLEGARITTFSSPTAKRGATPPVTLTLPRNDSH
jgi:hypothetical protein